MDIWARVLWGVAFGQMNMTGNGRTDTALISPIIPHYNEAAVRLRTNLSSLSNLADYRHTLRQMLVKYGELWNKKWHIIQVF